MTRPTRATVAGRVKNLEIRPMDHSCVLAIKIVDATGELTALFYGRTQIAGVEPGTEIHLHGPVRSQDSGMVMINPAYELVR